MKKSIGVVLALILCLSALVGCSSKKSTAEGDSGESKELTVYTALEDEQIEAYTESFTKEHPDIKLNFVRDSTGVITSKLVAEGKNTPADVVWGTAVSSLLVLDQHGMIEPYAPEGLTESDGTDRVIPELKDTVNDPPKWVGLDAWELAIVVNTEEAKALGLPEITSYQDLLDPAFKDKIVMSNPNSSGTGFLAVTGLMQLMGEEKAYEYLDKLNENVAMYVHSGSAPAKKAAAGEFPVGISYGYAGTSRIKEGAPVEVVFPKEGSGWDIEGNALIKKDKIKPEAKEFLDWAISDDAIKALKDDYAITSVKVSNEIPEGYSKDPLEQLIPNNDLEWAAKNRDKILAEWTKRYDGKSEPK